MPSYVNLSGPFFDGRADAAVEAAVVDIAQSGAQRGKELVDARLPQVLKYPTGRYQAHIQTERRASAEVAVNDGGRIVYGPWLEGVGSRNFPETRFKGYFTFRLMGQVLEGLADSIGNSVLRKYLGRMN